MSETSIEFINDQEIDPESYLWRYMDLHKFLSFIFKKSFFLTRLDKFEDNREGISLGHLHSLKLKKHLDNHPIFDYVRKYHKIDSLGDTMNHFNKELEKVQKSNFANCWVLEPNNAESVAMWNLYSSPNSLALKIKYRDFKNAFLQNKVQLHNENQKIVCAPISYINFQNPKEEDFNLEPEDSVFIKDISFKHESEFRIILKEPLREIPAVNYKEGINKKSIEELHNKFFNYPGVNVKLTNFSDYPFEVVHHPKSQKWAKRNIENIMKLSGIKFNISNSSLDIK